jgi:hypothetical protein
LRLGCTVAELLSRISSKELTEWIAFSAVEPFGGDADYLGSAIVAQTVANVNRSKGQRPYKVKEFLPKFDDKPQSVDEMMQFAEVFTHALGGEDRRE